MTLASRKNLLTSLLLIAVALVLLDRLAEMYLDVRQQMVQERDAKAAALRDAQLTLQHQQAVGELLARLGPSLRADASQIEWKILHQVHDWEQQTGVVNVSFQRSSAEQDHGYTRLTFQISASGNMASIAGLLYRVETSSIPLRVDDADVRGKDAGDQVQIHLTVSTPCHSKTAGQSIVGSVAGTVNAGGQG